MLDRGKVPWPLWLYVVLTTGTIVVAVFVAPTPVPPGAFSIVSILVWNFFLLRGIRWLWIATIVIGVLSIGFDLVTNTGTWYGTLNGLLGLALLIAPTTRQFFAAGESVATS